MRKLIVNEPQTEGRRGVTSSSSTLEDVRVGVRLKISALWIAMLFLFAPSGRPAVAAQERVHDPEGPSSIATCIPRIEDHRQFESP